ncbi:MAG: PEP-CTERM sorting domain-containing protein [bacterium]|nr:PEP-CTERM sorting domain-containing protein [bacterium]
MKKFIITVTIVGLIAGFVGIQQSVALNLGDEITISDLHNNGNGWHSDREDQETEPGTATNQSWDLEGMFLDGTTLSLVGGYDFMNGHHNIYTGDIFIDIDGDMVYGEDITNLKKNGNKRISNVFGYDYVIDMTFNKKKLSSVYHVYKIDKTAKVLSPFYRFNDESGAYRYVKGGELIGSGDVVYKTGFSDAETGFLGGKHNVLSVDLGFLTSGTDFTAHYTMGCGNDDVIGAGTISSTPTATPEPGTLLLLGGGLFAIIGIIRKRNA